MTLYIFCVALPVSKEKIIFYSFQLNLYQKRVKYTYDVALFNGSMTGLIV